METIVFKVLGGTKAKLKQINANVSALMREAAAQLIAAAGTGSAFEKAKHLCGVVGGGPANASTSKDYLGAVSRRTASKFPLPVATGRRRKQ